MLNRLLSLRTINMIQELERGLLLRGEFFWQKPRSKAYLIKLKRNHTGNKTKVFYLYRNRRAPMEFIFAFSSQLKIQIPFFMFVCPRLSLNNLPLLNIPLKVRERPFPHVVKTAAAFSCPLNTVVIKCTQLSIDYLGETSRFVTATNSIMSTGKYKQAGQDPPQAEYPR